MGSAGAVPGLSQLRVTPRQSVPAVAGARSQQRSWLDQAMAAVYTGVGGGGDGSCVVAHRGATLLGAAMAASASAVTRWPGRGSCSGVALVCLQASKEG